MQREIEYYLQWVKVDSEKLDLTDDWKWISMKEWQPSKADQNGWKWAINGFHLNARGPVWCEEKDGKLMGKARIEFFLSDLYDFNNDPDAFAGLGLDDADWHRMHKVGLAKEFYVKGMSKVYEVSWELGGALTPEDIEFEGTTGDRRIVSPRRDEPDNQRNQDNRGRR